MAERSCWETSLAPVKLAKGWALSGAARRERWWVFALNFSLSLDCSYWEVALHLWGETYLFPSAMAPFPFLPAWNKKRQLNVDPEENNHLNIN